MIRFLHAADLHLDTPFEGIARVSETLRARLMDASLEALDKLVEAALSHSVNFVVLAGDLYDGADRGIRAQMRFLRALERLSAAEVQVFIVHGNHDPVLEGWSAIRDWPTGVHIFGVDDVGVRRLEIGGQVVTVSGISYGRRDVSENLALRFERPTGDGFHVAVLHANVGSAAEHAAYSPCVMGDLIDRGYDYWALGHIHKRQVLRAARPFVGYPGNIQGRSFKASECGPKGANLVTVSGGGDVDVDFIELGPIRFVEIEVNVTEMEDMGTVVGALVSRAGLEMQDADDVVARARIVGFSALYKDFKRPGTAEELLDALQDRAQDIDGLWWTSVRLEVVPERTMEAIVGRDDLLGSVADLGACLREDITQLREILGSERALGSWVTRLSDDELLKLVNRAVSTAVTLVE